VRGPGLDPRSLPGDTAPVEQHFIPRFYLAGFQDPTTPSGQTPWVWIADLQDETVARRAPKNVGARADYYSFPDGGEPNEEVETLLGQIESRAAPIIVRLRNGDLALGGQERADLGYFIAFLAARVPAFRDVFEKFMGDVADSVLMMSASRPEYFTATYREANRGKDLTDDEIEEARQAILRGGFKVRAKPAISLLAAVEAANDTIYPVLDQMRWAFVSAGAGDEFVTCDNPVSWLDPTLPPGFWGRGGLGMARVELTFPIGPKLCLLATWEGPTGAVLAPAALVSEINRRRIGFADRFVFATSEQRASAALGTFQEQQRRRAAR
jgi:uncharacterized protein DUF4238